MKIFYTSKFQREYKKLPNYIKDVVKDKTAAFRQNPFEPLLKTHKLKGILQNYWSFSVSYDYRIIFKFAPANDAYFHSIGNHNIYR